MGRILSNTYYKSIELYDGGSIEPVPHSGSGENLGPVPGGLEKDVVLLVVVEVDVRELAVLRGQEVEHVKGRLPVEGRQSKHSIKSFPLNGFMACN